MSDSQRLRAAAAALWTALRLLQDSDRSALTDVAVHLAAGYATIDALRFGDDQVLEGDDHVDTFDALQ